VWDTFRGGEHEFPKEVQEDFFGYFRLLPTKWFEIFENGTEKLLSHLTEQQNTEVWIRHISVVWGIFLGPKSKCLERVLIKAARFLRDRFAWVGQEKFGLTSDLVN